MNYGALSVRMDDFDDLAGEIMGHLVGLGWVAVAIAGEHRIAARLALGQVIQLNILPMTSRLPCGGSA